MRVVNFNFTNFFAENLGKKFFAFACACAFIFVIIFLLISNSLYLFLIRNKTTIKFDKKIDSFYKITPIAKKKICNLSSILAISSKSKSNSFYYQLTIKNGKSNRYLRFTSVIKSGHGNNPEIRFLQMEIIPQLELFLNTNKNKTITKSNKKHLKKQT